MNALNIKKNNQLKIGYITDVGRERTLNEDSIYIDKEKRLFIIADGMGGTKAGEVASRITIDIVSSYIKNMINIFFDEFLNKDVIDDDIKNCENVLIDSIKIANETIFNITKIKKEIKGMGSTIILLYRFNDDFYIINVGDSRAYMIYNDSIEQISEDHSLVMEYVKEGKISLEEARNHPENNIITQCLGSINEPKPFINKIKLNKGIKILLCSDGLNGMLMDNEIKDIVNKNKNPMFICKNLVTECNKLGGYDNISIILIST